MKIQYLGFIPAIILFTACHIIVIKQYLRRHEFYDINPILGGFLLAIYFILCALGVVWGITGN